MVSREPRMALKQLKNSYNNIIVLPKFVELKTHNIVSTVDKYCIFSLEKLKYCKATFFCASFIYANYASQAAVM